MLTTKIKIRLTLIQHTQKGKKINKREITEKVMPLEEEQDERMLF